MLGKTHVATTGALFTGSIALSYSAYSADHYGSELVEKVNTFYGVCLGLNWSDILTPIEGGDAGFFSFLSSFHLGLMCHIVLLILCSLFGALLPDIDTSTSTLGRYVPFVGAIIPHRTITHTIWAVLALGIPIFALGRSSYLVAMWIGYVLHIVEDTFSRQGIAWFYPIDNYRTYGSGAVVKKGRNPKFFYYRTGSDTETGIFYVMSVFWILFSGLFLCNFYF